MSKKLNSKVVTEGTARAPHRSLLYSMGWDRQNLDRPLIGVANAFNSSAQYQGVSAGVGVGADTVTKVTANPATLTAAIMAAASGTGLKGVSMPQLAGALGTGIASLVSTASGFGTVTGAGGPTPAAGTSVSRVV